MRTSLTALLLIGLASTAQAVEPAKELADNIGKAHNAAALAQKRAIEADITVEFGGATVLDGRLTFTTDGGRSRFEPKSGGAMVFDGANAWVASGTKNVGPPPRFHLLTWSYFALAPFKLNDGGTVHSDQKSMPLQGKPHDTFRLTFAPGTGDAPKDWYVVYADPASKQMKAMAYIVTYAKTVEEAEKEPHAIVYDKYEKIDGVPISTEWAFYDWNAADGVTGKPIGKAMLKNVKFVEPDGKTFDKPEGATEDPLPGK